MAYRSLFAFLFAGSLLTAAHCADAASLPLFPASSTLMAEANDTYDTYFANNDWTLKTISVNGKVKKARYTSSMVAKAPELRRTGLRSWIIRYELLDRYRVGKEQQLACRSVDVKLKHLFIPDETGDWSRQVLVENRFPSAGDACLYPPVPEPGDKLPDFLSPQKG